MTTHIEILAMDVPTLSAEIERHNRLYWDAHAPEISDELYDLLVERLRSLEPNHPTLLALDASPATPLEPAGRKVAHDRPMLSLEKCYSESELLRFFARFEGGAWASHKIDGLALSLRYGRDGRLERAATRGDGSRGDDVTANAAAVLDIPTRIASSEAPLEVRGEVYLPLSTFRDRFQLQFANPRNLAAGALKQKDPARTADYGLRFFAYDLTGDAPDLESERRLRLEALGFRAVPGVPANADNAQATFESLAAQRDSLDYETDGVVFRAASYSVRAELGENAHHPRWAIAYKFQGDSGMTELREVLWNVSRTGAINPIAVVDPVQLSGVTVTRISLHNLGIIESLAHRPLELGDNDAFPLSPGARLLVTRRGGVIPHVEGILDPGASPLLVPTTCPSCGAPTERREDVLHAAHRADCATQRRRALLHFGAVLDIQGLGPRLMEQLDELELVRTPSDLYRLRVEDLLDLERFGEKSAENLVAAIDATRSIPGDQLLAALGIPDVGRRVAQMLLRGTGSLEALRAADDEALQAIDGIGPAIARSVVEGLGAWSEELDRLLAEVSIAEPEPEAPADPAAPLAGAAFVFTGELASMKRREAQERVRALGGLTPADVTRDTRWVVLGDADYERFAGGWRSSKLKKAEKLRADGGACEVIPEARFLEMLATASPPPG